MSNAKKNNFQMLLDEVEDTLLQFESRCLKIDETTASSELSHLFRFAHNIKGACRVYGLQELGSFMHLFEGLIEAYKNHPQLCDSSSVDFLLSVQKFLMDWVHELTDDENYSPDTSIFVSEFKIKTASLQSLPASEIENKKNTLVDSLPSIADLLKKKTVNNESKNENSTSIQNLFAASTSELRLQDSDEFDVQKKTVNTKKRKHQGHLKISSLKIDEIMQLIGELSIQQSILWHHQLLGNLDQSVCYNAVQMNQKTLKDLQVLILSLRMQPIEGLFQRVERSARELAKELNKKVKLNISGDDVMLDKTVIEKMADPLIHLIRNAIDHGIEHEEERILQSKSVPAVIELSASQDSGQVVIKMSDDGRGINTSQIYKKAKERSLIKDGQKITESELIKFIFEPGFSTRDDITEISGRGVGMDVVQQSIHDIGGSIDTKTRIGHGTVFSISLPTSLEIVDALVLRVSDHSYIVPMQDISEILEIDTSKIQYLASGSPSVRLRNQLIPIDFLEDYLSIRGSKNSNEKKLNWKQKPNLIGLLVKIKNRDPLALIVDEIITQQQIVVRPLSDHLINLPGFSAVGILGNGEPSLIISIPFIIDCYLKWIDHQSLQRTSP